MTKPEPDSTGGAGLWLTLALAVTLATASCSNSASAGSRGTKTRPDTTPPMVFITAPVNGATVPTAISVTANASDNVALAGVQFQVDGSNVGRPIRTAPYTYSLDTTTLTNARQRPDRRGQRHLKQRGHQRGSCGDRF